MITIISPAKKLNLSTIHHTYNTSTPYFAENTKQLADILRNLTIDQIKTLMKVSDNIAELNFKRFQELDNNTAQQNSYMALFMFAGEVYNGLDAASLSKDDINYANNQLRILSGLYGILKPLDLIKPYRLEMGTKLKNNKGKDLYSFWQENLTQYFNNLKHHTIINLASNEYYSVLNEKELTAEIVTPIFKDYKNGTYKTIMMYAKKARGLMARYIIENKITDWQKLQNFNVEKYIFHSKMSNIDGKNKILVFTR